MKNIEELEDMIKENRALFQQEEPQAGHLDRFLEKYDQKSVRKSKKVIFRSTIAIPLAASLLVILGISIFMKTGDNKQTKDYFAQVENQDDPYEIYITYMHEVGDTYQELSTSTAMMNTSDNQEFLTTLANITDENRPITETLPEEMSDAEKAKIARDYYNERLNGVETLKKSIDNYSK